MDVGPFMDFSSPIQPPDEDAPVRLTIVIETNDIYT